ncbi:oligosaccharide flippase family protein [Paenibacillus albicereus]|uniref:Oligosaccharide flippase family protein n=1 Tax=Paenibacillus albicereus TaxID=2726185 RepID=A0A6H2GS21_9BACL|nr:oligosaccharide flippase family protein [Paenibacillus albicereus]QJC50195.1 oligosaccharide flippase family protein [Paenibacillus albicereus]
MDEKEQTAGKGGAALGGAALLAGAALLSKLIGTLQKIPLQNVAGDRVFGIYNAVYPLYQLILVLATAGLPVAVAIRTAALLEQGDRLGARRAAAAGVTLLSLLGAAGFVALWMLADRIAGLVGDPAAALSIRAVASALWFVPALAALRGYTQGLGDMRPTAWSQLAEQVVRVAAMLLLLRIGWSAGWGDDRLAAGAMGGSFFGAAAGLALLAAFLRRGAARPKGRKGAPLHEFAEDAVCQEDISRTPGLEPAVSGEAGAVRRKGHGEVAKPDPTAAALEAGDGNLKGMAVPRARALFHEMRALGAIALPAALGAIVAPVLGAIDAFTVPRLLRGDMDAAGAMTAFGLYSRGQPLIQLVAMVAGAAAGALVPQLVRHRRSDPAQAAVIARLSLRASGLVGAASALGLVLLARPLNILFYADAQATGTLALVGSTALAAAVSAVAAPLLQGLGALRLPAALLGLAALAKAALNAALVPSLGIAGAAAAGLAATALAAGLGALAAARSAAALSPAPRAGRSRAAAAARRRRLAAAALALAALAGAALAGARLGELAAAAAALAPRASAAMQTLGGVLLGAGVYGAALLRLGAVDAGELGLLPGGERLAARLRRWRLLP